MKLNKYFMLGLAGLAFAACSNDEIPETNMKGRAVVKLSLGTAETKSLGTSASGLTNKINDLSVYFYDASSKYVLYPENGTIEGTTTTFDNTKAIADAVKALQTADETTLTLNGIPSSATQIYIIANKPAGTENIGIKTLDDARASKILLRTQLKLDADNEAVVDKFSGENSTLTGLNDNIGDGTSQITVELKPVASRMEVCNLKAKPAPATYVGRKIKSFTVKGIFINAFYPWGILKEAISERTAIDQSNKAANYSKAAYKQIHYNSNGFNVTDYGFMCDEPATGTITYVAPEAGQATTADGYIYEANTNNGKWWGYQLLPGNISHFVIKLGVLYEGETQEEEGFLTIIAYHKADNSAVTTMERGYVYRIENLEFDVTNITQEPYQETKAINALIKVLKWQAVDMLPDFK